MITLYSNSAASSVSFLYGIGRQYLHSLQLKTCKFSYRENLQLPSNFKINYCYTQKDCIRTSSKLLSNFKNPIAVGLDAEWNPIGTGKVAVIQLCMSVSECYIFHLSRIGCIPLPLKKVILHKPFVKVGLGIENDLKLIHRDYFLSSVQKRSKFVDIGKYAFDLGIQHPTNKTNWSLQLLTEQLLNKSITKNKKIKLGNWDNFPLNSFQLEYAAKDAYVSLLLFYALEKHRKSKHLH